MVNSVNQSIVKICKSDNKFVVNITHIDYKFIGSVRIKLIKKPELIGKSDTIEEATDLAIQFMETNL